MDKGKIKSLKKVKLFVLDIDGTFYVSKKLVEGAQRFSNLLKKHNKKLVFLTNNSNKSKKEYLEEFDSLGYPITENEIYTAGIATAEYLKNEFGAKKIYLVGTPSIIEEYKRFGHEIVEESPQIVVVTFDKTLTYEKLAKASIFVSKGALFVATNPDLNCPSEDGPIPDTAAIASSISKACNKEPDIVFGKPEPKILEMIMDSFKVFPYETCMVGDRLYTDILIGIRAKTLTALVLTGEAKLEDLNNSPIKPDLVAKHLGELSDFLEN
ncbi:HAD-IIA family hydrolase [Petrotoga sp. 9PWA.NaAc.5.4]|uniref:HAD-IIA family hydrolase n=1 Tax=Petrotoga sp. 9PWA.NaAc.5.4 TaxID=1434328 RepID=UPI000EFBA582|nr:HAD-IIA family hydrolase [Petrotoga sp. 9PWA.NaAc.5.4]